jgi:hypothetical protein
MKVFISIALVLALTGPAAADGEPRPHRDGFMIGLALGPGFIADAGFGDAGGAGGHVSLRVGTVATPTMQWVLQLDSYAYELSIEGQDEKGQQAVSTLALAAQLYLTNAMWVKGGGGFASVVTRDSVERADGTRLSSSGGFALIGGGGIDLVRSGMFVLDLESNLSVSAFGEGALITLGLGLGLNWY